MRLCRAFSIAILGAIALAIISCATAQNCPAVPEDEIEETQGEGIDPSGAVTIPVQSGSGAYENSTYGFSMSYPDGWLLKEAETNSMGLVAGFLAPGGDIDNPMNYVTVQVELLPAGQEITLDQYTDAITSNLKSSYKNFRLLTKRDLTLANLPGKEMLYTVEDGSTPYEVLLQYAIKDGKAYVLSYYAIMESYPEFEDGAREIMGSFEFTDARSTITTEERGALVTPLPFSRG